MATVTAALVKELRERTGAGMMECKKALVEANADIEVAIENMRKSGAAKAAKKAGRVAAEGVILVKENEGKAAIVEINCETDFVAKDANFAAFANQVAETALAEGLEIDALKEKFEQQRAELVAKIGENMDIRRVSFIEGAKVGSYRHGDRIGVVVAANADEETIKHVAMHIAASKPEYVNPEDVPADVVEKEKQIQVDIAMQSGKPAEIAEKMVVGRMKKFTGEISLTGQAFVMDPAQTVGQMLKEKGAEVTNFIRFEVGEGIEKEEVDFAAEVAAAQKG
ncbi:MULTISPECIES: translation elongation factor Ts [Salinivibrio]|jgi:elongation factor Ts|uniref:Elongation factor Ts n=2 Tax=Salinivibrio TaxID=51366 RepID=A0ABY7LE46_9GAMM|nr:MULTISPECIES: translation elongation factor Ts [Salinivibrio]ODQ00149.1 translation elongation factor Ts [Salinivibrio sp. DV]OOF10860.1 translation elongation factor Ts [Salinivibrio sp. PR5]OOF19302.1 translation elongation factor Ts [Salinivibrio sp. PR932]OOF20278.1 translation elongation factor Ts [Salinivibrio sp. IB574]OOF27682.1 translation elongation factor Ts [Salinivibrio sp. IB872]